MTCSAGVGLTGTHSVKGQTKTASSPTHFHSSGGSAGVTLLPSSSLWLGGGCVHPRPDMGQAQCTHMMHICAYTHMHTYVHIHIRVYTEDPSRCVLLLCSHYCENKQNAIFPTDESPCYTPISPRRGGRLPEPQQQDDHFLIRVLFYMAGVLSLCLHHCR